MIALSAKNPGIPADDYLGAWTPVEVRESGGDGRPWLKLPTGWTKILAMENRWELDGFSAGALPVIRMHFKAVAEGHGPVSLAQDLCTGHWFRQVTLAPSVALS